MAEAKAVPNLVLLEANVGLTTDPLPELKLNLILVDARVLEAVTDLGSLAGPAEELRIEALIREVDALLDVPQLVVTDARA